MCVFVCYVYVQQLTQTDKRCSNTTANQSLTHTAAAATAAATTENAYTR
jgi:hypothetical protein